PGRPPKKAKSAPPVRLGDYEIHRSAQGFSSIRQLSSGEVMHSVNAPSKEADKLYVGQSCLALRLLKQQEKIDELVIWDVGLGAAFNAMAVIRCIESCYAETGKNALHPVRLLSFECNLDPLTLVAKNPGYFPHVRHAAP